MELFKNRYLLSDIYESNLYITTYQAYDTKLNEWCLLEIPNIQTSWTYNILK